MVDETFLTAAQAIRRRGAKPPTSARLLADPALDALARRALAAARGRAVEGATQIEITFWQGGRFHVDGGETFPALLAALAEVAGTAPPSPAFGVLGELIQVRASVVAPKGEGWVIEPVTNRDGRRTNESTLAMHGLMLDCDGTGQPFRLLALLELLGLAFIFYESGGHRPDVPKWRVLLPLARSFPVDGEERRAAWKTAYLIARVIFGAAAALGGEGFDACCDPVAQPWFLAERRTADAPPRHVAWRPGAALDLEALIAAVPTLPVEDPRPKRHAVYNPISLTDEKMAALVESLASVTCSVPSGRRALYFALSSALLSYRLDPDDMIAVVEAVSAEHGGDPKLHDDNRRIAEYVAAKHTDSDESAGALANSWPEVMEAIEEALPEVVAAKLEELNATNERLFDLLNIPHREPSPPTSPTSVPQPPPTESRAEKIRALLDPPRQKVSLDEARAKIAKALREA